MKHLTPYLVWFLTIIAVFISCQNEELNEPASQGSPMEILYVKSDASTKVIFDDRGTSGIALQWKLGDRITVYQATGPRVGTFYCDSVNLSNGVGRFIVAPEDSEKVTNLPNGNYVAVYPSSQQSSLNKVDATQNDYLALTQHPENALDHFNKACIMRAPFTRTADVLTPTMTFKQSMSFITVLVPKVPAEYSAESEGTPTYAALDYGGEDVLYLNLNGYTDWRDSLKLYFITKPTPIASKVLNLRIYTDKGQYYYKGTYNSNKTWDAGKRYTATFTVSPTTGYTITDLNSVDNPENDLWVFMDNLSDPYFATYNYQLFISKVQSAYLDRNITIIFPNSTLIPQSLFNRSTGTKNYPAVQRISFPAATVVEANAFPNFHAVQQILLSEATSIGNTVFNNCPNLKRIYIPKAESLGANFITGCNGVLSLEIATENADKRLTTFDPTALNGISDQYSPNIDLIVGAGEAQYIDQANTTWRGKTFKSITIKN